MSTPDLFDEALRRRRVARAARRDPEGAARAGEIHALVADRLIERLAPINRRFPRALVLGPGAPALAAALAGRFGVREILTEADAVAPQSLDLAVSALELHALNDPIAALVQARLALKPDGLFLGALFGGETLAELRACLAEAEIEVSGGLSPRVAPMAEIREAGALLQRAGLALPVADSERLTLWHATPLALMREIRALGETNALTGRRRVPLRRATLGRALALYAERFGRADGKTRATLDLITLTGWAPAETQQQPLRPGSATARLAEALGTTERSAGEKAGE